MDTTIRIWDTESGVACSWQASSLKRNTRVCTWSTSAYSPAGQYILSGFSSKVIRIWDAETGTVVGQPRKSHIGTVAYSPHGQYIVSGIAGNTTHVWDSFLYSSIQASSPGDPAHAQFSAEPDPDGRVRDLEHGLLYWVP